jgi:hypothetical protein
MTSTILRLLCLIPIALRLRSELALENLALRQQLAVLSRQHRRPKLLRSDRVFWLFLSRFWVHWREALIIVNRHCRPMAPEAFRIVLEAALPQPSRSTWNRSGDPRADTEDGEI